MSGNLLQVEKYLKKSSLYGALVEAQPSSSLGLIVTMPCYNEPDVISSVIALLDCSPSSCDWEVIILINASLAATIEVKAQNQQSYDDLMKLQSKYPNVHPILINDLPPKHAGVGLARKIAMDEAARRLHRVGNTDGVIACYDADSSCRSNYLEALYSYFINNKVDGVSIHYEHPLSDTEFDKGIIARITQYELHLRYYVHMQAWCGLPYAHQTVGSSMAVTCKAYAAIGGMNKRKAGEDFYFMHKIIKYGRVGNISDTMVIPSPRISDRVPFGTGRAIGQMTETGTDTYLSYDPRSFIDIKNMVDKLPEIYSAESLDFEMLPESQSFFQSIGANKRIQEIKSNTSSYEVFEKRFYHWFDAFLLMKFLHYLRDHKYKDLPVVEASLASPLQLLGSSAEELLAGFRTLDKIG